MPAIYHTSDNDESRKRALLWKKKHDEWEKLHKFEKIPTMKGYILKKVK